MLNSFHHRIPAWRFAALALGFMARLTAQSSSLSFALNSDAGAGFVSINVMLTSAGSAPAAVEWTFSYPSADFAGFTPVAAAANKLIRCSSNHCVVYGLDKAPLQNGLVAVLTFPLVNPSSTTEPFSLGSALAATSSADANAVTTANGGLSVIARPNSFPGSTSAALRFTGSFPDIAVAQNWDTTINLVNTGKNNTDARVLLFGQNGNPLRLPMSMAQGALADVSLDQTLAPGASLVVDSSGPAAHALLTGSGRLFTDAPVAGFIRYRYDALQQEASVPLETRTLTSLTVPFDNTNGYQAGLAITNLIGTPANVPVTIRDDSGNILLSSSLPLPANGQNTFLLGSQFPAAASHSGTVKFDPPATGPVSVMGIRFPPSLHFSTIPVLADSDASAGSFAHVAIGGGWTTTLELVNRGATAATAQLNFFNDDGSPLSVQIVFPQTGQTAFSASINQTMAARSRLVIVASGPDSAAVQTGSASFVCADGAINGFMRHHYAAMDQESLLPLESRNSQAYIIPFDQTNGLSTGIALANTTAAPVPVTVVVRDATGAQIASDSITLPAHGHTSFPLTDRIASAAGQTGTIEFDTPSGGQISVMGVRLNLALSTFSAIPTLSR